MSSIYKKTMTEPSVDSDAIRGQHGAHARGRARELLARVLSSPEVAVETVADALMVSTAAIDAYRTGRLAMPLEVQLLLAALTIERVPKHARLARQLRAQIKATISYAVGETVIHKEPPPRATW